MTYYAATKIELNNLIKSYADDKGKLWEIPITSGRNGAVASAIFISEQLSCPYNHYHKSHKEAHISITQLMINEGVIVKGNKAAALELRRKLLNWWSLLNVEDKKKLTLNYKGIKFKKYIEGYMRCSGFEIVGLEADKMNRSLVELGVIENLYKKNKYTVKEVKKSLKKLINEYVIDSSKLWDVPVASSSKGGSCPSSAYIREKVGCTPSQLVTHSIIIDEIKSLMINENVIVEGNNGAALEIRRQMIVWWRRLSISDKKELKCFGNKIQFKKYITNWRISPGYEIVLEISNKLNKKLVELGVLNKDYIAVKERVLQLRNKSKASPTAKILRWNELLQVPLNCSDDLLAPDIDTEPYIQVKHLFAAQMNSVPSDSGKSNYRDAFFHFTSFLNKSNINEDVLLKDVMHPFILSRFRKNYLVEMLDQNFISPKTAESILSATRRTCKRATKIKNLGFSSLYDVEGFDVSGRSTSLYKPYSIKERMSIDVAIKTEINEVKELMRPYKKAHVGEYPLLPNGDIKLGFGNLDNARYLFEEALNCKPVFYGQKNNAPGNALLRIVGYKEAGLHEVYKSWGILVWHRDVIAPFILRLAQITGMNADSICKLEVDDFVREHEVTKKPCLRYWKERSSGEKEYHLDLFNAELQWLTVSQSSDVLDVFETVKELTAKIRKNAPEDIKKRLFIFQSSGSDTYGHVLAANNIVTSIKNFVKKYNLVDEKGKSTQLNIARFRPSFVSDMIEKGVSIREIQLMLGHKNIQTTMNYLDRLDFNRVAREKVKKALSDIHKRVLSPLKSDESGKQKYIDNNDRIIFNTPLAGCSNIFQPPQFIKKSKLFVEGQACSQFNKCLGCDNVMLISAHLPELFAMRRDYLILMQRNRIMDTPYGVVVEENIFLLAEMLLPEKSDFTLDELEEGERLSQYVETAIIDGVGA